MPTATGGHSEGERRGRGLDSEAISCAGSQVDYVAAPAFQRQGSGRSAAWLAHLTGGQGVGGSNPLAPTTRNHWSFRCSASRFLHRCRHFCRHFRGGNGGELGDGEVEGRPVSKGELAER